MFGAGDRVALRFSMRDPVWTTDREECWWGITNTDGTPRAAYTAWAQARPSGALAGISPVT